MNVTLERLNKWGCDVRGALERFVGDEDMYIGFLNEVVDDKALEKLGHAIKVGNIRDAFHEAHTLKGVHGNLGLTPLYQLDIEIVEPLRIGKDDGVSENYELLIDANDILKQLLG